MACHAHTHEILKPKRNNLLVCLMKDNRSWPHTYTRETDRIYLKNLPTHPQKSARDKEKKKKNIKYKAFCVTSKCKQTIKKV